MPRKGISYEQVARVCNDLQKTQRLSVRAIQEQTGGSMTTVLKHYRRWQRQRSGELGVEQVISERLRHALLSELEEAAARSRQAAEDELQVARQQLDALRAERARPVQRPLPPPKPANSPPKRPQWQLRSATKRAAAAEAELRSIKTCLHGQKQALERERSLRRAGEAALRHMQSLKEAAETRLREQEQRLRALEEEVQDPQQTKKGTGKKSTKKAQQSLFDF